MNEYRNLEKGQITRQLQAIHNEVDMGWKQDKVQSLINDEVFDATFVHFMWGEDAKIITHVTMTKVKVEDGSHR